MTLRRKRGAAGFSSRALVASVLLLFGAAWILAWSSGSSAQAIKTDAQRSAHMREHFGQVMSVHEAVIRGDLPAVAEPATWLATHEAPATMPAQAAPYVAAIRQAAGRAASAKTLAPAAFATAAMLAACGDCHRAVGTMPSAPLPSGPDVGGLVGHMLQHQRAVDLMLQGLTVPSATLWRDGASALQTAALRPEKLPPDPKLTPEIIGAEARLHRVAGDAVHAADSLARANAYGQILASCSDCHSLHKRVWGPSRR